MLAAILFRVCLLPLPFQKNLNIKIYNITVLPVMLYGCETWPLTLREERVFENSVLRRIFVPKREEVTGGGGGLEKTA
jgi:hypothetical protein